MGCLAACLASHPLDATHQNCLQTLPTSPGGKITPSFECLNQGEVQYTIYLIFDFFSLVKPLFIHSLNKYPWRANSAPGTSSGITSFPSVCSWSLCFWVVTSYLRVEELRRAVSLNSQAHTVFNDNHTFLLLLWASHPTEIRENNFLVKRD